MTEKDSSPEQKKQEKMKEQVTTLPKKKEDKKQEVQKKEKIKKDEAVVRGASIPISTKDSVAICRFIKKKSIEKAIADLGEVLKFRKAVPLKGEIPHRKGKGMMSGRYPVNAAKHFIKMLKILNLKFLLNLSNW